MWIFGRHDAATVSWNTLNGVPIDDNLERELDEIFGIDIQKIRQWRLAYPNQLKSGFAGQTTTRAQYDLIFQIAGLNRKIRALRNRRNLERTSMNEEHMPCEVERDRLIKKLQG
jgi:hypothetical protein